jgi:hypothetical protein
VDLTRADCPSVTGRKVAVSARLGGGAHQAHAERPLYGRQPHEPRGVHRRDHMVNVTIDESRHHITVPSIKDPIGLDGGASGIDADDPVALECQMALSDELHTPGVEHASVNDGCDHSPMFGGVVQHSQTLDRVNLRRSGVAPHRLRRHHSDEPQGFDESLSALPQSFEPQPTYRAAKPAPC